MEAQRAKFATIYCANAKKTTFTMKKRHETNVMDSKYSLILMQGINKIQDFVKPATPE